MGVSTWKEGTAREEVRAGRQRPGLEAVAFISQHVIHSVHYREQMLKGHGTCNTVVFLLLEIAYEDKVTGRRHNFCRSFIIYLKDTNVLCRHKFP